MAESKTAVIAALAGNAALAMLKGFSAAITGSVAMLAETFHSIADTGNQVLAWDAAASATIGVILIAVALLLASENYSLLIGESSPPATKMRMADVINADPAVKNLVSLHTMHLGPQAVLVVAQVKFHPHVVAVDIEEAVARLEREIASLAGAQTTRRMIVIEPASSARDVSTAA